MIYIMKDDFCRYRQGLNLYPLGSTHSIGGILRLGSWQVRLRWSKIRHRFNVGIDRIDLDEERKLRKEFFGVDL